MTKRNPTQLLCDIGEPVKSFEDIKCPVFFLIFFASLLSIPAGCAAAEKAPLNVLFIGNSYIYTNDLPQMFSRLAESAGHEVKAESSANPGWKLAQHARSETTLSMIAREHWDYVILQEQSVLPVFAADRRQSMYPAARILDEKAKRSGAKTILLITWGRRDGLKEAGISNFEEMQAKLSEGSMEIVNKLDMIAAPVGAAWQSVRREKPFFPLWQSDGNHPSKSGTYLAACVLFSVIFRETPEGIVYTSGLTESTSSFLQKAAGATVLSDADKRHLDRFQRKGK
jgi:hypothetical protein